MDSAHCIHTEIGKFFQRFCKVHTILLSFGTANSFPRTNEQRPLSAASNILFGMRIMDNTFLPFFLLAASTFYHLLLILFQLCSLLANGNVIFIKEYAPPYCRFHCPIYEHCYYYSKKDRYVKKNIYLKK